jgi:hypothetical protein
MIDHSNLSGLGCVDNYPLLAVVYPRDVGLEMNCQHTLINVQVHYIVALDLILYDLMKQLQ